ncbi:DUF3784 domain-containing protein [Oceanobacillus bengalensis]|uniref:Bacterial Pleckstrin homology domain-containing protein n=1 Tax=Oceanobacillus bengalensis TaxID=1435466 RepID=A0A494Z029_9BACI|nr:DUF3784 domain-containing protein [Oceanobacillus bengalensis]RKQ15842.1 hypothetical protein D8M05_08765 [Oceanobacillus bengalensis]
MNMIGISILIAAVLFTYLTAYFILKKQKYFFISKLRNRTAEEIKELEKTGYIKANGKLVLYSAHLLTIGLIFEVFGVNYAFEVCIAFVLFFLLIGTVYIQKYEIKERRRGAYQSSTISAFITIGIVGFIISRGFIDNTLSIESGQIEISGPYGEQIAWSEISEVRLLDELPEIKLRTNGYGFGNRLIGNFDVEELGKGKLYIHHLNGPYLLIETNESYYVINSDDSDETLEWYRSVEEQVN